MALMADISMKNNWRQRRGGASVAAKRGRGVYHIVMT
jgi:hypothetical protein